MFCPNCGKELPDGTAFCTGCGTQQAASAPSYSDNGYNNSYGSNDSYSSSNSYGSNDSYDSNNSYGSYDPYATNYAPYQAAPAEQKSGSAGILKIVALVLTIACIATMVLSYFVVMDTSIEKIAIVDTIVPEDAKDELEDIKDEAQESLERAEQEFKRYKDDLTDDEIEIVEESFEIAEELCESISLNNLNKAVKYRAKMEDELDDETLERFDSFGGVEEVDNVFEMVGGVILGFMIFCLAFCAFGGFFRVRGLVITGMIFSTFYGLVFCGALFTVLFVAIDIALCVVLTKIKAQSY